MDLYALPPGEFTAARDAAVSLARKDKDPDAVRALKALRRPSVAAYAVNRIVRDELALLEQLIDLGAALAQAQSSGDADALRRLGTQRRTLVEAIADRAGQLAGSLGPGPRAEVVATLEAAMADPATADAVRTGRLVRGLSYAGFGGVDLSDAVAAATGSVLPPVPASNAPVWSGATTRLAPAATRSPESVRAEAARREVLAAAKARLQQSHGELNAAAGRHTQAAREAEKARREGADAEQARQQARVAVEAAKRSLAEARVASDVADGVAHDAVRRASELEEALAAAAAVVSRNREATEQAQRQVDELRRP